MKKILFTAILVFGCIITVIASTLTVTTNTDTGTGSLREVISNASDGDTILFDDNYTIILESPLELGDKTISIDGDVNGDMVKLDGNFKDEDGDWIDDDGVYTNILLVTSSGEVNVNIYNIIIQNGSISDDDWEGAWGGSEMYTGGGVYVDLSEGGTFTMTGCTIKNNILSKMDEDYDGVNQTYLQGAGIYSEYGGDFVNCIIKNNVCVGKNSFQCNFYGAGAYTSEGGSFSNCLFAGNSILFVPINNQNFYAAFGAGLYLCDNTDVTNCLIVGNYIKNLSDELRGYFNYVVAGGILANNAKVYNTTVVGNGIYNIFEISDQDQVGCGGAFVTYSTIGDEENSDYCDYQNNIFYGNYCSSGEFNNGGSSPEFTKYSAFPVSDEYDEWDLDTTNIFLDENPFFALPSEGDDGEWGTDDDDYGDLRLIENSTCIDAGNPDNTQFNALSLDFYERERITNGLIDIGAVEAVYTDYTFSLRGSVWEGVNNSSGGNVYAISIDDTDGYAAECDIDENGNFEFTELFPGEYYFVAVPYDQTDYLSTYYGDESSLENAISINVDDIIYDVDIHLVESGNVTTDSETSEEIDINIYPNPATDYVYINGAESVNKISLYNSLGINIKILNGDINKIPVSNLAEGIYIIVLECSDGMLTYHFIKK